MVLSRYKNESIMVGEDVEVMVVDIRGNKVRLGITASKDIPVHRKEVYKAIQREKTVKNHRCKRRVHENQGFPHKFQHQ